MGNEVYANGNAVVQGALGSMGSDATRVIVAT
jgi:hypothetical protein